MQLQQCIVWESRSCRRSALRRTHLRPLTPMEGGVGAARPVPMCEGVEAGVAPGPGVKKETERRPDEGGAGVLATGLRVGKSEGGAEGGRVRRGREGGGRGVRSVV